jgi:para-nitrobenzyl esterase
MFTRYSPIVAGVVFALCLSIGSAAYASDDHESSPGAVVATDNGSVKGTVRSTTITFLGVPFAQPPIGDLRWRPPEPRGHWKGLLDATQFRPHCPQPGSAAQPNASEDCLFLNVYVPKRSDTESDSSASGHGRGLPVMVWIYGGANASGASDFYDPTPLVEAGGVVVVTVNYRIGALGFLAHPALDAEGHAAVNYGVMDQQLALRWVQKNIARFGGDPWNVTIFGESAGGLNTTIHLVSPLSAGLFHAAIIESGAYQLNTASLASSEALGVVFANRIRCTDQSAACLRSKSLADVLANAGAVNTPTSAYNQSTVDGQILPEVLILALRAGRINRVPVIQGANSHEVPFGGPTTLTAAGYRAALAGFATAFGKTPDEVLAAYPVSDYPSPSQALGAALGDYFFACGAQKSNQALSQWVPTYAYEFDDAAAGPQGPAHGAEIRYLFNLNADFATGGPNTLPAPSQQLALAMRQYWTNFAWSRNPNFGADEARWEPREREELEDSATLPDWGRTSSLIYGVHVLVPPSPHFDSFGYSARHKCAFWN